MRPVSRYKVRFDSQSTLKDSRNGCPASSMPPSAILACWLVFLCAAARGVSAIYCDSLSYYYEYGNTYEYGGTPDSSICVGVAPRIASCKEPVKINVQIDKYIISEGSEILIYDTLFPVEMTAVVRITHMDAEQGAGKVLEYNISAPSFFVQLTGESLEEVKFELNYSVCDGEIQTPIGCLIFSYLCALSLAPIVCSVAITTLFALCRHCTTAITPRRKRFMRCACILTTATVIAVTAIIFAVSLALAMPS